ncbi:MAG TPA: DUF378 domain-containing protein [Chloroflexota bacterium]|nr:DUF378 domain-containing protein [Chloroflexota bacterium]
MYSSIGSWVSGLLTVVGALNWGAVGIFGVNPVHELTGKSRMAERLTYSAVGLAGVFLVFTVMRGSRGSKEVSQLREEVERRRPVGVI